MTLGKIPTLDSNKCPDHRWHLDVQTTRSHHLPTAPTHTEALTRAATLLGPPPPTHTEALTRAATLLGQLHVLRVCLLHPVPPQPERVPAGGFPRVAEARNLRCWRGVHSLL